MWLNLTVLEWVTGWAGVRIPVRPNYCFKFTSVHTLRLISRSSMASSIICDRSWHLKTVAFECYQSRASVKIKDVACKWRPCTARLDCTSAWGTSSQHTETSSNWSLAPIKTTVHHTHTSFPGPEVKVHRARPDRASALIETISLADVSPLAGDDKKQSLSRESVLLLHFERYHPPQKIN